MPTRTIFGPRRFWTRVPNFSRPGASAASADSVRVGEHYVAATLEHCYILRVSGLFGSNLCRAKGPNFVDKMLDLRSGGGTDGISGAPDHSLSSPPLRG